MSPIQLLVSDANILIDLEEGLLLSDIFSLPYQFSTPDILFHDELEECHHQLVDMGLKLGVLTSETLCYAEKLINTYSAPSRYDCFALALAKQEKCPLLSGDKRLRKAAENEGVIVKGTLWLVNELITQNIISISKAQEAFGRMQAADRRLPWDKVDLLLKNLE